MKKAILTTILSFLFIYSFASHNRCGYIKAKTDGNLNVEATIITYTNASAIPADRDSLEICWGDGVCEFIVRDTSYILNSDLQFNSYTWSHDYSSEGNYVITLTDPNRTGGITNLFMSDQFAFHVQTTLFVSNFPNETPDFLNPPFGNGELNVVFESTPEFSEPDGDSLSFELITPLSDIDFPIPGYAFPNEINPSSNNNFNFDELTGQINWDAPQQEGRYIITYKIKEYRNDVLISEMIFDCELWIGDFTSVNNLENLSISIFPNPVVNGYLFMNFDSKNDLENGIIQIVSTDGKVVLEQNLNNNAELQSIDIQRLTKGIYIAKFAIDNQIYTQKIVKY